MRELVRSMRVIVISGFKAAGWRALFGFLLEPLGLLLSTFTVVWVRSIVDGASRGDAAAVRHGAITLGVTLLISGFANAIGWRYRTQLLERTGAWIDQRVMEMGSSLPGLEHHERAEYHDKISQLHGSQLGNALIGFIPGVGMIARLIATSALLATLHPLLLLLPVFGIPSVLTGARAQKLSHVSWDAAAPYWRRGNHLYGLGISAGPAKELRVFGIEDEIADQHLHARTTAHAMTERASIRGATIQAAGWAVFALGYLGAVGLIASRAVNGEASIGDVTFAIMLAGQINGVVSEVVDSLRRMTSSIRSAGHYLWLEDLVREGRHSADGQPPSSLADGIRFADVSFTYPGTETTVLEHVNLHLPAGARIAIVGDNGAGKTTLVKLLCGFYRPTSGTITVDGDDLAQIDVDAWRERLAGGFQDYCRFELRAREAVGLGDLPHLDDTPVVVGALERAGAGDLEDRLPQGLETQLGKTFEGGVDLSMGQWQKLALGRAFMRERPLLLVLDEPTASLDAKTEHALFQRYAEAASARAADGAITLLVSHRFSTVRSADLIIVVEGGSVREVGSHADLIARGGLYAELFSLQASAYR